MIALAIIGALIGAMIILANPFIGLLTIVVLIPLALVPAVGNIFLGLFTSITPIKIIGGVTFVAAFFHQFLSGKKWDFMKEPMVVFYIWFLIYVFINGFSMPSSFTRESFTFYVSIAAFAFLVLTQVNTPRRMRVIIWTFLITVFIVSVQSILNYVIFHNTTLRMAGGTFDPNYFAISLLPFISISFYNIGVEKSKFLKFISLVICLTLLGALAVTQSRGGFVGLAGMLLIAFLTARKKYGALIIVLFSCFLIYSFMPGQFWQRFAETKIEVQPNELVTTTITSTVRRYYLAKAAWEMFLDYPIFGVGLGNYYWECPLYYPLAPGRAHNMYLEILAEMGMIGIFLFAGILISYLKCLGRLKMAAFPYNLVAKSFFIGHMGFFIAALFLHAQQEKGFWLIMFMAVAMERLWRQERPVKTEPVKREVPTEVSKPKRRKMYQILITGALLSLLFLRPSNLFAADNQFDKFGGWKGLKGTRTGVFHVEEINDRWWIITPEGHVFWSTGMYSVRMSGIPETGTNKRLYQEVSLKKHGSEKEWARVTRMRLYKWGFNTIGDWSAQSVFREPGLAYVAGLDLPRKAPNVIPKGVYGYFPDVFAPEFKSSVVASMKDRFNKQSYLLDDPWLLGYFLADEPSWYGSKQRRGALVDDFIALEAERPGKKRWVEFLKEQYPTIQDLNENWSTKYKSFEELLIVKKIHDTEATKKDKLKFLKVIALEFSKILVESLRQFDLHHMVLGTRPSRQYPEILEAIGEYSDIFSISAYGLNEGYKIAGNYEEQISNIYKYTQKPILLGVLIRGQDVGLPYGDVRTQKDRGISYWRYIVKVASDPRIVGVHWFQYFDPPKKCYDKMAANWGIVNEKDEPYEEAVELIKQANKMVYSYALGLSEFVPEFGSALGAPKQDISQETPRIAHGEPKRAAVPIVNGDFEKKRQDWKLQAWKGKSKAAYDFWVKHGGMFSLKIKGGADNGWDSVGVAVQYNPKFNLKPGKEYILSAWIKTDKVPDFAYVRIRGKTKSGGDFDYATQGIYGTQDWTRVEKRFTPSEENTVNYIAVQLVGGGVAWFDDVRLEVLTGEQ